MSLKKYNNNSLLHLYGNYTNINEILQFYNTCGM